MPTRLGPTRMKELVEAHYDAAVNAQDLPRIDEQLTPDFLDHGMPPGTPRGTGPVKEWLAGLKQAFPDLTVRTEDLVAEADRVAVRAVWEGTHREAFRGVPASGRAVRFEGAVFWRFEGERLAERWPVIPVGDLMRQLRGEDDGEG